MARDITDDEIQEWLNKLTEDERFDLIMGINMRAALLLHKLFPDSKVIWDLVINKS
jgi:hypothetical protein